MLQNDLCKISFASEKSIVFKSKLFLLNWIMEITMYNHLEFPHVERIKGSMHTECTHDVGRYHWQLVILSLMGKPCPPVIGIHPSILDQHSASSKPVHPIEKHVIAILFMEALLVMV